MNCKEEGKGQEGREDKRVVEKTSRNRLQRQCLSENSILKPIMFYTNYRIFFFLWSEHKNKPKMNLWMDPTAMSSTD